MIWSGKLSQAGHNIAVDGGASFSCMAVIALRGSCSPTTMVLVGLSSDIDGHKVLGSHHRRAATATVAATTVLS